MKKLVLVLLVFVIFICGCQKISESKSAYSAPQKKSLSDMQVTACNAAHEAGTCGTRLAEIGIVTKEDCCKALGKCC